MKRPGLQSKLVRVFIIQTLVISIATFIGVYAAAKVVEDSLMREALQSEAEHFWSLYNKDSTFPLPNTKNMLGYLSIADQNNTVPIELRSLSAGYTRTQLGDRQPIVYVSHRDTAKLYLVFDEESVSTLAFYFGVLPLSIILLIIYLLSWVAYQQSKKAVSPIIQLTKSLNAFDIYQEKFSDLDIAHIRNKADAEVTTLLEALDNFTQRLDEFVNRERMFTRDASHELRTPIAVIRGSVDLLKIKNGFSDNEKKAIDRIEQTSKEMEELVKTLLLLARESETGLVDEPIILNDLIHQIVEKQSTVILKDSIAINLHNETLLEINTPEKILTILVSNLIRNACNYTKQGQIDIFIKEKSLIIQDSGVGMSEEALKKVFQPFVRLNDDAEGTGLGLSIIKRLCERFDWQLHADSKENAGTTICIIFNNAKVIGRKESTDE